MRNRQRGQPKKCDWGLGDVQKSDRLLGRGHGTCSPEREEGEHAAVTEQRNRAVVRTAADIVHGTMTRMIKYDAVILQI